MGNSLCSHPALLISDFGGIYLVGEKLRIGKLGEVEVHVCHPPAVEIVDRLGQRASREALERDWDPGEVRDEHFTGPRTTTKDRKNWLIRYGYGIITLRNRRS